jgi:hypothetical protein
MALCHALCLWPLAVLLRGGLPALQQLCMDVELEEGAGVLAAAVAGAQASLATALARFAAGQRTAAARAAAGGVGQVVQQQRRRVAAQVQAQLVAQGLQGVAGFEVDEAACQAHAGWAYGCTHVVGRVGGCELRCRVWCSS